MSAVIMIIFNLKCYKMQKSSEKYRKRGGYYLDLICEISSVCGSVYCDLILILIRVDTSALVVF
jgi:hypothetical protein